jgi:ATP-binding cassette subfamily C exporter for protease/lipase
MKRQFLNEIRMQLARIPQDLRKELAAILGLTLAINLLTLVPTLYMLQLYDRVVVSQNEMTLLLVSLIVLYLFVMLFAAEWFRAQILARLSARLDLKIAPRVFAAMFQNGLQIGRVDRQPLQDLAELRTFATGSVLVAFLDAPFAFIFLVVLFVMHPLLGWLALILLGLQLTFATYSHRRTQASAKHAQEVQTQESQYLQAKLDGADAAEAMGSMAHLQAQWQELRQQALMCSEESQAQAKAVADASKFLRYVQQAISLGAGAILVIQGSLSPISMIAANVLMTRALSPVDQLVGGWRGFHSMWAAAGRLYQLLSKYSADHDSRVVHDTIEPSVAQARNVGSGVTVECKGLSLTVQGRVQPVLKNVSAAFPLGTLTVVMGPSGSGKSSLVRLILGACDLSRVSGGLLVNGQPHDAGAGSASVGYLPQEVELFDASVAENIARLAEPDPHQVVDAAKLSAVHDAILNLPQGYETQIGDDGRNLSGGMRQRLGLARALYGAPRLLVLDEPDASLDQSSENLLHETIKKQRDQGVTVILISHRPIWVNLADRLLIMANGEVQASGPKEGVLQALARNAGSTS